MKCFRIPINKEEFLYTMPAPIEPNAENCNSAALQNLQVNLVVSLLTDEEVDVLGLKQQAAMYLANGIGFIHFPISDFGVPESEEKFIGLVRVLSHQIELGQILAIHCKAGIGRSSLMAAAVLIHRGFPPMQVFEHISEYRQASVPDKRSQAEWLFNLSPRLIHKI